MKGVKGFTLMELMITVAILGIIVAVAFPSYQQHVVKSNRAAAQAFMMEVADRQKQYLLDARAYAPDLATLNVTPPANVARFYGTPAIAIVNTPPGFTVTATPLSGTSQSSDGALTLDSNGTKNPPEKW
jgi:type IV pilus assembly protein PilE